MQLSLFPEESQELQKEIDEVEIESECSHDCLFLIFICSLISNDIHSFDLLCIIGCECDKDNNTNNGDDEVCESILEEEVDESCYHDAKKSKDRECSDTCEITLGGVAIGAHGSKYECCHSKNRYNRTKLIHEKYHGKCQSRHNRIEDKKNHRKSRIHLLDEPTESHDESKFEQDKRHEESSIEYELHESRITRNVECHTSGDDKSKSHPGIDSLHEATGLRSEFYTNSGNFWWRICIGSTKCIRHMRKVRE